jgi:hypothetical protein
MIYNFDWKLGQKVAMLVSLEPAGAGSIISAAIKNGAANWEFMTSFYVPQRHTGLTGGYAFLEDFEAPGNNMTPRSFLVGPTILEDEYGKQEALSNVYVDVYIAGSTKRAINHRLTVQGTELLAESGISEQSNANNSYRIQLPKLTIFPNYVAAQELLSSKTIGISTRASERILREQKAVADAKVVAEKKTTITCIKGKLTKKITAVKPKCPSGYKKK